MRPALLDRRHARRQRNGKPRRGWPRWPVRFVATPDDPSIGPSLNESLPEPVPIEPVGAATLSQTGCDVGGPAKLMGWGPRALYLGPAFGLTPHRNATAVLAIGLDGTFDVADDP